jgi:nucleotide-binding universal stress UspA family protein
MSSETHLRKFLVLVDDSPECQLAIYFAARRASHTNGLVSLLYVIPPAEFQHWAGVGDVMRDEARETAERVLLDVAQEVTEVSGHMPELIIREGQPRQEIQEHIIEDHSIKVVVLAASTEMSGRGPIISSIATNGFREDLGVPAVPLTIVPGSLSREEIDFLT